MKIYAVNKLVNRELDWITFEKVELVSQMEEADLVYFGEDLMDVAPSIWGDINSDYSGGIYSNFDENYDLEQIKIFIKARKLGKKIVGVMRGANLISALSGAYIYVRRNEGAYSFITTTSSSFTYSSSKKFHILHNPFNIEEGRYGGFCTSRARASESPIGIFEHTNSMVIELAPWENDSSIHLYLSDCLKEFLTKDLNTLFSEVLIVRNGSGNTVFRNPNPLEMMKSIKTWKTVVPMPSPTFDSSPSLYFDNLEDLQDYVTSEEPGVGRLTDIIASTDTISLSLYESLEGDDSRSKAQYLINDLLHYDNDDDDDDDFNEFNREQEKEKVNDLLHSAPSNVSWESSHALKSIVEEYMKSAPEIVDSRQKI